MQPFQPATVGKAHGNVQRIIKCYKNKRYQPTKIMKTYLRVLAVMLFFVTMQTASANGISQVRYEVRYNASTCLYEAHAHVVSGALVSPTYTIPFPSQFSVVVPAAISDVAFSVVASVSPPGVSWGQANSIFAPAADPAHDFHSFSMQGGGAPNAYTVFNVGTDILLFTFSVPHVTCEDGIRCFDNNTDPNSSASGMGGINFTQSFKTGQVGDENGIERYLDNLGSPVVLPKPSASASNTFSCDGGTLHLFSTGSSNICSAHNSVAYSWTGPGFSSSAQNPSVTSYSTGTYTVSVTDYNGCAGTASVSLSVPFQTLAAHTTVTPITCNGYINGTATASGSGGTPGYTYVWNNALTTATITGLSAGTYTVTVTDAASCTATASAVITQPDALFADAGADQQLCQQFITVLTGNIPPAGCTGVWSLVSGPQAVYFYPVFSGNMAVVAIPVDEAPYVFKYTITRNSDQTCSSSDEMQVFNKHYPSPPYAGPDQKICLTSPPVIVTMAASTPLYGTGIWTQVLSNPPSVPAVPAAVIANPLNPHTTITITTAGTYNFLWTVSNGNCIPNEPNADTAVVKVYSPPAVYAGPDLSTCSGSAVTIEGSTATGECMTLLWTTSGTGIFDNASVLHPVYTPGEADNIAGSVTLTLTGTIGCCNPCGPAVVQDAMVLLIHQRPVATASVVSNVTCNGAGNGSVTVTVSGGSTPYTYLWNDNLAQTTATASGLSSGTYTVTVTDSYGCKGTSSATVTQPTALSVSGALTHVACYTYSTGAITASTSGGTPPYAYLWSNSQTSSTITGLSAGAYSVTVSDAHACTRTGSWTVTQPDAWSAGITGPGVICCIPGGAPGHYCATVEGAFSAPVTYQWVVVGGTISSGQNTSCIDVVWSCCGQGTVTVVVTKSDGCHISTTKTVIINTAPAPDITGPATVTQGDAGTVYCTPDFAGHLYTWVVVGGSVTAGQGTHCITVTWGTSCNSCNGSVGVFETYNGCTGSDVMAVTIMPGAGNLTGSVTYDNSYNTGLNGVIITLYNQTTGTIAGVTTSGPDPVNGEPGYYTFAGVADGTYKLTGSYNGTWGGNNATDALIVQLNVIGTYPLSLFRTIAADVNASTTITGLDALYIKLRTIGSITSYPAGDWKVSEKTVVLAGSPLTGQNMQALCTGDVNGSFIPYGYKSTTFLSVIEDSVVTVPAGEPFVYTIRSSRDAELGAMTLFLGYDQTRYEVVDILNQEEGMKYTFGDGKIAIAWADTKPLKVNPDDLLVSLNMRVKEEITEPSRVFSILPGSEFADVMAGPYDNFDLKMSNVITPDGTKGITMYNYPNPFANSTNIVYTLPDNGHVKLVLTDLYGKTIRTLADGDNTAGSHTVTVDPAVLQMIPGVYLYKIIFDSETDTYVKVNKMVFTR